MTGTRLRRLQPVLVLATVALALRLAYVLLYPQLPLQADAYDYDRLARSVAAGAGFRDARGEPETLRAPLYPLAMGGLYAICGPEPGCVRVAQAALGALLPVLVLALGWRCFVDRVAWAAAGLSAAYPALIAYAGLTLTETCASLLVTAAALCAVWANAGATHARFALLGFTLGLTALCRAELAALAGAMVAATLLAPERPLRIRVLRAAILSLAVALTVMPWTMRNHRLLGAFVPLTLDGWRTLWIASYPDRWLEWKAAEPVVSIEAGAVGPLERSKRYREAALENLRSHPDAYALMTLRRIPLLLVGGHSNVIRGLEGPTAESTGWRLALKVGLLVLNTSLMATAGLGLWLARRSWPRLWPLYLSVLVPAAVYLLLFAVPRYHIPFLPIVMLFAAHAVTRMPGLRTMSPERAP